MFGTKRAIQNIWLGLFLANCFGILWYWYTGTSGLWNSTPGVLVALGRITGLAAAFMILVQFLIMSRLPWLEQAFGLNKLSVFHSRNGKTAFFFLLAHPILIISGYRMMSGLTVGEQVRRLVETHVEVGWALVGLTLLFVVIGTSLYRVRSKVRYESWYFTHLIVYLSIFLSFWHQIELGGTLTANNVFYGYWIALYGIVLVAHLLFRFVRPLFFFARHRFTVLRVEKESPTAISVYISGKDMERFRVRPGQFMTFRFFAKGMWWQAHPFSLSAVPNGKEIRITIRELGDFTKAVQNIQPGTKVLIEGPFGVFTEDVATAPKALMIAGGIGITPVRSLAEEMLQKGKDVVLLYGNRSEEEIVFRAEIEELQKKYPMRIIHVLSDQPDFEGEKGFIDEEKITRLVPDTLDRDVYVCGPPPMMNAVIAVMKKLGLSPTRLHHEKFAL